MKCWNIHQLTRLSPRAWPLQGGFVHINGLILSCTVEAPNKAGRNFSLESAGNFYGRLFLCWKHIKRMHICMSVFRRCDGSTCLPFFFYAWWCFFRGNYGARRLKCSDFTPAEGRFRRKPRWTSALLPFLNIIMGCRLSISQPLKGTQTLLCGFHAFSHRSVSKMPPACSVLN